MNLLGYVRVSTKGQAVHGHSLSDDQPERLAAYCAAYGYCLVDVISDQTSARKVPLHKRPGGAQVLERLAAGEADGVIVIKLDRMFRHLLDGLDYFKDALYPGRGKAAGRGGSHVVSLAEHIDTSTAAGRHMLKFTLLEADAEADRTGERTRHAMQGLRQRGRVFGHVPYGCIAQGGRYDQAQGRVLGQQLFREPTTWPLRQGIVDMRLQRGLTLEAMATRLRRDGVTAPGGGERWSKSTLNEIVRTHDSLSHLPLLGADSAAPAAHAPETTPSPGAAHVHH